MFRVESDATSKDALGGDATTDGEQEESEHLGPQKRAQLPKFFREILAEQEPFLLRGAPILARHESAAVNPVLLLWSSLVHFLAELDVVSRVYYCEALDDKLVGNVMLVLFSQIPDPPGTTPGLSAEKAFTERIQFESAKHFSMEHFVCNLFYRSLTTVPALVRQWYNSLPKSAALAINRYVRTYVSPLILRREMRNVANMKKGRLEVKVMPRVNEISATYKMEESSMTLNVSLPEDYPLSLPTVQNDRAIVSRDIQRRWLLQLTLFLTHQNGSMLDGILQWKYNIDKHLEGVEDCTICMSTVSTTNYQLPKIRCKQCKKKFHGDCLYKWFQTANNSSCPLCRSNFV